MEGKTQPHQVDFYNLDMIISVGYRVNSHRGVQFRQWATQVLKEYMIKGFVLNDDLLKNANGKQKTGINSGLTGTTITEEFTSLQSVVLKNDIISERSLLTKPLECDSARPL